MKNLSRVLFFSLLALISTQTFAQKFGIQGGVNFANMLAKDDDVNYSEEYEFIMNLGFNAGVTFEMGFGDLLALEVGLLADTKGYKIKEGSDYYKDNLIFADIPVLLKVGPSLGPVKIFAAVGPFVGIGLTGKMIEEYDGEKDSESVSWGSDEMEDDYKRLDYGAKFGIGAEAMNFTFGAYYSLGLANLTPYTENGSKMNSRALSISVGYKFGK